MKIAWYCPECLWLTVSDSRLRHYMDTCLCKKTSMDLEEGYCRFEGKPIMLARLKDGETRWIPIRKKAK